MEKRWAMVGWSVEQLRQRRHFLAQNSRFLVLGDRGQYPNLVTRGLALCCARLSEDWLERSAFHWMHQAIRAHFMGRPIPSLLLDSS